MGILDMLFGKPDEMPAAPPRPEALRIAVSPAGVYAPASGELAAMADIPDPVFASGAMGPAVGIAPSEGVIYAPVSGTITVTTGTLHAVGLRSDAGIEILIHVGVDTVNMKGDGFTGFVEQGQSVAAGEPLMVVDLEKVAQAGYSDMVIVAVTNASAFARFETVAAGSVSAGEQIMDVSSSL